MLLLINKWFLSYLIFLGTPLAEYDGTYHVEAKRPFGGVYGRPITMGRRSSDFENAHLAAKRPFGRVFGRAYKLGKRDFGPPESHITMKRPFGRIFGNYRTNVHASTHEQTKRPFGSIYRVSYSKRPFGGVYGNSYKIGKRYVLPHDVHKEVKRPFGKVYGRSYKFGKRPFGQVYGKYGKRSVGSFDDDAEIILENTSPSEHTGHVLLVKRPFGKIYGKRDDVDKRPFGQIYSTRRPFGKRSFPGSVDFPMMNKRPFGKVYGRSYRLKKSPYKIYTVGKGSFVNIPDSIVDEPNSIVLPGGPSDRNSNQPYPAFIEDAGDLGQKDVVFVETSGYDVDVPGSGDQTEDQDIGEVYTDSDGAMEEDALDDGNLEIEDDSEEDSEEE